MVTIEASDLSWNRIDYVNNEEKETNTSLFEAILVTGKDTSSGYTGDKVQLIPLKEGTGVIRLGTSGDPKLFQKYYVHVKKVDGELTMKLEETTDFLPTAAELKVGNEKIEEIQNVSLSTIDGKKLSDSVSYETCNYSYSICIDIDQPGEYIATVQFAGDEEVRFGVEAKEVKSRFYYDIRTLKEQPVAELDDGEVVIGKHTIRTKNAEQMATVTRDPGTNLFRATATGSKEGIIYIDYEYRAGHRSFDGSGYSTLTWTGINVVVQRMGPIVNVGIGRMYESDH